MNDLAKYLASTPRIKNVVLLGGKDFNPWMIYDLCKETELDSIAVYLSGEACVKACMKELEKTQGERDFQFPENFHVGVMEEVKDLERFKENCALVFDALDDPRAVLDLTRLQPTYLCGSIYVGPVSTFDIWEAYRGICEVMHLITWGNGRRTEVLHWEKRPDSDVELSVIFPMYNVAGYLPQCIESVTAWKAPYIEFLFVDDGSPDNCAQIVEEAAKKDPRIKLLQKENGGCASARQYGLERAKGRYIGFIDPDDFIDESMYRKLLRRAMIGSYEISYCGYNELYTESGETREVPDVLGEPYASGTIDPKEIIKLCAFFRVAIWRGIYSAEMIKRNKIHFYTDLRRFDDLPFKFETMAVAKSVVSIPEYLYYYRLARPGQDVSADDERLYVHFPIFQYLDAFVQKKGSNDLIEVLQIVKLQTHRYAIEKLQPQYVKEYLRQARKDLLSNLPLSQVRLIYASQTSLEDQAYFKAIMRKSPLRVKRLAKRSDKKAQKAQAKNKTLVARLEKFG